jgi:large subunit ribosomal protein L3
MVEGLIGKKIGMTQYFNKDGSVVPVTVIKAGPCAIIQKKTAEKDGYRALQIGFIEEKEYRRPAKPVLGHFKKSGIPPQRVLREVRFAEGIEINEGDQISVDIFQKGEQVHIIGMSKGKGFAGVVKRWGFHGGKATHGSMFHRAPGSIGASAYPSRVVKGKKLPGHLGNERVTVRNLSVVQADSENNLLLIKGPVPGASGGYLLVKKAYFTLELSEKDKEKIKKEQAAKQVKDTPSSQKDKEKETPAVKEEKEEKEEKDVASPELDRDNNLEKGTPIIKDKEKSTAPEQVSAEATKKEEADSSEKDKTESTTTENKKE